MFFAEKEICPGQAGGWWAVVGANNCAVADTQVQCTIGCPNFFLEFGHFFGKDQKITKIQKNGTP